MVSGLKRVVGPLWKLRLENLKANSLDVIFHWRVLRSEITFPSDVHVNTTHIISLIFEEAILKVLNKI